MKLGFLDAAGHPGNQHSGFGERAFTLTEVMVAMALDINRVKPHPAPVNGTKIRHQAWWLWLNDGADGAFGGG